MSIHVCKCTHNGREEYHLRYPGMTEAAAQELADEINGGALSYAKRYKEEQAKRREEVGSGATATDGHCALGDDHCNCGGDVPAVRAGCANWIRPNLK